ncbi:hypothetical protein ACFL2Q_00660 [Thermodesulfobacteriota bacterium]
MYRLKAIFVNPKPKRNDPFRTIRRLINQRNYWRNRTAGKQRRRRRRRRW